MPSDNDFSAIVQLMDVKHLYEEQEEKWKLRLAEKDAEIARFAEQLTDARQYDEGRGQTIAGLEEEISRLKSENERVSRDYQNKISQLNERIKELNQRMLTAEGPKVAQSGFFKK
jgi:predicted nuclease with TOPRIM domain